PGPIIHQPIISVQPLPCVSEARQAAPTSTGPGALSVWPEVLPAHYRGGSVGVHHERSAPQVVPHYPVLPVHAVSLVGSPHPYQFAAQVVVADVRWGSSAGTAWLVAWLAIDR